MSRQPETIWPGEICPVGHPSTGDVIICRMDQASQTHALRIMPKPLQIMYPTYIEALACATNFAALDRIDVWLERYDGGGFILVERNRTAQERRDRAARGSQHEERFDSPVR